jgi:hypothetical protein
VLPDDRSVNMREETELESEKEPYVEPVICRRQRLAEVTESATGTPVTTAGG